MAKNLGESGELLVKAKILHMMQNGENFCDGSVIKHVHLGDFKSAKGNFSYNENIQENIICEVCESGDSWTYDTIKEKLSRYGITKAGSRMKADLAINEYFYSLKSSSSRPAIINHTFRDGFSAVAKYTNANIDFLDTEILRYWENRTTGKIGEDLSRNTREKFNLFWSDDFKEKFRSIFNYFAFKGSGAGLSKRPADLVLEYSDPLDSSSWKIMSPDTFYDTCWLDLIFCIRNKNDKNDTVDSLSEENRIWARKIDGKIRGRLHVRTD